MRRRRISLALAAFLWILAVPRTVETFSSLLFCKCVVFNATSGVFQTPNYPRAVSKGTCYLYHFAAPPQHTVRIRFDTFELEKRQAKCVDYVRIFEKTADGEIDDDSPHDGEYCGDEITPNAYFLSSTNHMILYINIEIGADSRGFRGHYQFIPNEKYEMNAIELSPCEFTANTFRGSLFSPRAPYYYLSNTVCTYHVPPRRLHVARIRLIFLEFPHNSCDLHFLKISEMKPKRFRDKLCFNSAPPYEIFSRNGFLIEFAAGDNSVERSRGFQIDYDYFDAKELEDADSALTPAPPHVAVGGSAPFPELYESPLYASPNSSSSGCPIRIISPASNDNTINKTGNLSSWILFQDNHLPRPSKCQIIFVGSGHERVQVSFPKFNLFSPIKYNNTQRCEDRDHLTAHVLVGTRMSRIDDFCADRTPPQLMSSKNLLTLDYVRKPTAPDDEKPFGFFLKYQFRTDLGLSDMHAKRDDSKPCQFIFNSTKKTSGNLWSPNHPGLYPRNINCNYIFHGTATQVVVIHFEYFDVEGFAQCEDSTQSDYVLFSNYQTHDRTNRRYCGRTRPSVSIVSESNYFRMMFKSNDIFEATGFYAHYQFITPKSAQTNRVKLSSSGASSLILSISTVIFALYLWINS